MTYSILGHDPDTGEVGIAVQSKFPGVGSIIAHGRAGVGVVATQAFANPDHGPDALDLMALGASPDQTLEILLSGDGNRDERQIALMAADGTVASHTGAAVLGWAGHAGAARGRFCVAHGNSLSGEAVPRAMADAFDASGGEIAARLIGALDAGQAAGGELRGQQSAAVLVVKKGGGYGGRSGRHVDINVYDHATPIDELRRCYALHRLSYFPSDPKNLVEIDDALRDELRAVLRRGGYLEGDRSGSWDETDIAAMARFMGTENYDNRIRDDALIDLEVLADIRAKHR